MKLFMSISVFMTMNLLGCSSAVPIPQDIISNLESAQGYCIESEQKVYSQDDAVSFCSKRLNDAYEKYNEAGGTDLDFINSYKKKIRSVYDF
jgi:hypothetical protein